MMQAVFEKYPSALVKYKFKWRNWDKMKFSNNIEDFVAELNWQADAFCDLRFPEDELAYLSSLGYFKLGFIEFLRNFRPNRKYIKIFIESGIPAVVIEGPWLSTILFEVPILHLVSSTYTKYQPIPEASWVVEAKDRLCAKFDLIKNMPSGFGFSDFSTRRCANFTHHNNIIEWTLKEYPGRLVGTSNVYLAKKHGIKAIGTMAHEWIQAHQQLGVRLIDSQKAALQTWADVYRGELGIALSDCITFDAFLVDFDRYFSLLFEGCRHDSGDPYKWCSKLIKHYKSLRIEPKTKQAIFSDGLDFNLAKDLWWTFNDQINVGFGIGTYYGNDCAFIAPQIVLKMVECNGMPVAKISDSKGKGMCENFEFEKYLLSIIQQKVRTQ